MLVNGQGCFADVKQWRCAESAPDLPIEAQESLPSLTKHLFIDALTGLENRTKLIQDIKVNRCPVLFLIDIDGFSQINNHFGLAIGDAVLSAFACRIKKYVSTENLRLYKLPADGFALLGNIAGKGETCDAVAWVDIPWDDLSRVAERLIQQFENDPLVVEDDARGEAFELNIQATIGIAVARVVGRDNLLTHADIALKTAKQDKIPFRFYKQSTATKKEYEHNVHWVKILREATAADRVVPFFQPIRNNHTNRIEKYEALIRLIDENDRPVAPTHFLDVSRVARLYPKMMIVMAAKSLRFFRDQPYQLSINLGVEDIRNRELVRFLRDTIFAYDMGPKITFEILESEDIERYAEVARFIGRFRRMGCKFSIDDFGVGYSNFFHVVELDFDFIKIDSSLIRDIDTNINAQVVVRSIIRFAGELGIETVAEGVSTAGVDKMIRQLGIDYAQGYLVGRPQATLL